jgi:hypothetical protein
MSSLEKILNKRHPEVPQPFIGLFLSVADYIDGGCQPRDLKFVRRDYERLLKDPTANEIYSDAINIRGECL